MKATDFAYLQEQEAHDPQIDEINEEAFGPGREVREAEGEGERPEPGFHSGLGRRTLRPAI